MNGRKIASLLQQGYRMPKPKHVDYELYVFEQPLKYNIGNKQPTFRLKERAERGTMQSVKPTLLL